MEIKLNLLVVLLGCGISVIICIVVEIIKGYSHTRRTSLCLLVSCIHAKRLFWAWIKCDHVQGWRRLAYTCQNVEDEFPNSRIARCDPTCLSSSISLKPTGYVEGEPIESISDKASEPDKEIE